MAKLDVEELVAGAKSDRNRAVDFYKATAMVAVAFGHWVAIAVFKDADGDLVASNALEFDYSLAWATWALQVMPLFFLAGGFSSAVSLDSHERKDGRPQDWVASRLRRMMEPTMILAYVWIAIGLIATALGVHELAFLGAAAAAIPLWFLANYTIDTAIAPYVLPLFRRYPVRVPVLGLAAFGMLEGARFAGIPALPQLNWVLGWLLFQVLGFAWRDGLLPTGRTLMTMAGGLWALAVAAVAFGPWPTAMVHFPGLENSPTHPPSLALMLFGAAYSTTAIAVAPRISAWLARSPKAWAAVVSANAIAMSVYLWHFTAAIAATAIFHLAGWLPTAAVGTSAWWIQKLPLMAVSAIILVGIVARVARIEQQALLAPRTPWTGVSGAPAGQVSLLLGAAALSTSLKQWAHGDFSVAAACIGITLALWHGCIKARPATQQ